MDKKYKLIGLFNYFDIVPCCIFPIFMDEENNFYWAFNDDDNCKYTFTQFLPFPDKYKGYIRYLSQCELKQELEKDDNCYQLGDMVICSIQLTENEYYIGRIDKYLKFLKEYKADFEQNSTYQFKDLYLKELSGEIDDLEVIVNQAREQGALEKTL